MPDCFISFSTSDRQLAEFIKGELATHGISTFLAPADLQPGEDWSDAIWNSLRTSRWVLFLASRAGCASPYVQQELGHALGSAKKLIPIVWDMNPAELPGWTKRYQALDLRGASISKLRDQMAHIAGSIRAEQRQALFICGALVLGVLLLSRD